MIYQIALHILLRQTSTLFILLSIKWAGRELQGYQIQSFWCIWAPNTILNLNFPFTSGTEILKKAENVSMICDAPDDHRLQLMTKTSTKSRNWCLEIIDSFGNLLTWLEFHLDHCKQSWRIIWTVFFDYRCVAHYEFLPTGQTVKKEYYLSVMHHLREAIRRKRPEL